MAIIIDGKKIAENIKNKLRVKIINLPKAPTLAVILVGNDPASALYVKIKEKTCQEIGINFNKYLLSEKSSENNIMELITSLNKKDKINGIIIQLPLPKHLDTEKIVNSIEPHKDVDGLGKNAKITPPTAAGIMEIFKYYNIKFENKNICLVGYGRLVGKPLAKILNEHGNKIDICTTETKNLRDHTKKADILISATGTPGLIKKNMVKTNAVVIDAGTSVEKTKKLDQNSKVYGDVDFENVKEITSYITPPKGGVGPITVAKLLENVVSSAKT